MARYTDKALQDLEFPAVLAQVQEFCVTDAGKEAVARLRPKADMSVVQAELKRLKEFTASYSADNPVPNHGFEAIENELHLLSIENSTLPIAGFRKILHICYTTATLKKYFKKYREFYVDLHQYSERVTYSTLIADEINRVLDRYGQVRDDASELLQSVRKRLIVVKGKINSSFSKALGRYNERDYLDEIRESVVENRRVLAVRAMHRRKVKGAVLGQSKTGSIVYIEPQETLEYANELSNLLYEESEEIKKILWALTAYIAPYQSLLENYQAYLTYIDTLHGRARYANKIEAVLPRLTSRRGVQLINAYHPLLLRANNKKGLKTYPQTISLEPGQRIIVVSGPNAGGKSITLKTIGLLQLMLQSGMLLPVDPESEFCFFDKLLTDIGDNQSIENHLSTYSYRLKMMRQFLKQCDENTLFLIDEFGTGSDPELGGALAETFLEVFYEREAYGVITTHYTNLKLLANELPNAVNANMQFDNRSLEPMFKLHLGEAGSSFTFEVAQKNGIPYSLINKAKKKIARGKVRFDRTIANLQKERSKVRKTAASLETSEKKVRAESKQLEETNQRIQEKLERYQELYDSNQKLIALGKKFEALAEKYHNNRRKKVLFDELLKLVMVENSKRKKVHPKKKKTVKAKKKAIEQEVEKKVAVIRKKKKKDKEEAKKKPPSKPREPLKVGDKVRMLDGRAVGTIDSIEKKKAIVNYGMFTADVRMDELEKV